MKHNAWFLMLTLATLSVGTPARAAAVTPDTIVTGAAAFLAEHRGLLGTFDEHLRKAVAPRATRADRAGLVLFLRAYLMPHARAEEQVLYPAVDSVLGTRGYATATMVMDHQAIVRLIDQLRDLANAPDPAVFNQRAYALEALVQSHFEKEEQFVLPALRRRMSDTDLRILFDRMGAAEAQHNPSTEMLP